MAQLSEMEIRQCVQAAQAGDTDAFGQVYDHYFPQVYRYCAFRMQAEAAEDLVADVFVKAWEKLHTYKVQKDIPFGAWLFRIARYAMIDAYRTHKTWEEIPEEIDDPDEYSRADSATKREDRLRIIRGCMDKLPRRYREVLMLSYIGGLPHNEIARVLRLSEGGVRILKFRALKKLEGLLPPELQDFA